jgi:hypothetical protein
MMGEDEPLSSSEAQRHYWQRGVDSSTGMRAEYLPAPLWAGNSPPKDRGVPDRPSYHVWRPSGVAQGLKTPPGTPYRAWRPQIHPSRGYRGYRSHFQFHHTPPTDTETLENHSGWCVVFIEATLEHSQQPWHTCKHVRCSRLPPHYFRGSIGPTRHCPRSIPGAKPANNLPEEGLTLLTQQKL